MRRPTRCVLHGAMAAFAALSICTFAAASRAEDAAPAALIPYNQDAPPNPPRTPEEAMAAMTLPPGFRVELVAAEPDLVNPVAMTFDRRGRVWVTESLEYPRSEPGPGQDRVKILDDTDGDGRADKFTVFAEGLNIPSGIALGHGGVWVANAPDLLFLQDLDGDDVADRREVVLTGFGRSDTHELPNSLTWGPDGWLYGLNGVFNHSRVVFDGVEHKFNCAVWRYHPRRKKFELFAEGTSNPWGLAFNTEGSAFISACVVDHLWHLVEGGYYLRQAGPYPPFTWPIESIVDHAHQKAAYCGLDFFDSDAYPAEYRRRLYMGNIHGGCINVDVLEPRGATYVAHAEPDFLHAHDAWFMPVSQKTGPDGNLYILDWYDRYHCYQDARRDPAGIDRLKGRLYRVVYGDGPRRAVVDLSRHSTDELLARLGDPNVWVRQTAQQMLTEKDVAEVAEKLEDLVLWEIVEPDSFTKRMHALYARIGLAWLADDLLLRLLRDDDETMRAWAVRAAGQQDVGPTVRRRLREMSDDDSAVVQSQLISALRRMEPQQRGAIAAEIMRSQGSDPLLPQLVWQQLRREAPGQAAALIVGAHQTASQRTVAARAIERWVLTHEPMEREAARAALSATDAETLSLGLRRLNESTLLTGAGEAQAAEIAATMLPVLTPLLVSAESSPAAVEAVLLATCWKDLTAVDRALGFVRDASLAWDLRVRAFQALAAIESPKFLGTLAELLDASPQPPPDVLRGLLAALGRSSDPELGRVLLERYASMPAEVQPAVVELLTQRPAWAQGLVAAIEARRISAAVINANQLRKLASSSDEALRFAALRVFGAVRVERDPAREIVIRRTTELLESNAGDPIAGQAVFRRVCAQCHKLYGEGQEVGPDLTANGRNAFSQLMSSVLDPSLVIGRDYQARTVATRDGRTLVGLIVEDQPDRIVLKVQGGKLEAIAREEIEALEVSRLSMMPENLESQTTPRELVDLLTFLALDKPPSDPTAKLLSDFPRPAPQAISK